MSAFVETKGVTPFLKSCVSGLTLGTVSLIFFMLSSCTQGTDKIDDLPSAPLRSDLSQTLSPSDADGSILIKPLSQAENMAAEKNTVQAEPKAETVTEIKMTKNEIVNDSKTAIEVSNKGKFEVINKVVTKPDNAVTGDQTKNNNTSSIASINGLNPGSAKLIEDPEVNIEPNKELESQKKIHLLDPHVWVTLGGGVTYFSSNQDIQGSSSTVFSKIKVSSYYLGMGFELENWGMDMGYVQTPFDINLSSNELAGAGVSSAQYWSQLAFELKYKLNDTLSLTTGVQLHEVPFILPQNDNTFVLGNVSLTQISLGLKYEFNIADSYVFKSYLRGQSLYGYQSTFTDEFKLSQSNINFDGSIGVDHLLSNNVQIGVHWFGQFHDYGITLNDGVELLTGHQKLFHSTANVRVSFLF